MSRTSETYITHGLGNKFNNRHFDTHSNVTWAVHGHAGDRMTNIVDDVSSRILMVPTCVSVSVSLSVGVYVWLSLSLSLSELICASVGSSFFSTERAPVLLLVAPSNVWVSLLCDGAPQVQASATQKGPGCQRQRPQALESFPDILDRSIDGVGSTGTGRLRSFSAETPD